LGFAASGKEAVTKNDVDHLKQVARRFTGAFMAVSVLKDTFSAKEKTLLAGLAKWGRRRHHSGLPVNPLVIFTGTELFARWHVEDAWKEKGGKAKALVEPAYVDLTNLGTFAELTQQVYLDLARAISPARSPFCRLTSTPVNYQATGRNRLEKGGKAKALVEPAYVDLTNLGTFAELTQQVYLDLPPFSADFEKYRARRRRKRPVAP
jgi:hypothetical protein